MVLEYEQEYEKEQKGVKFPECQALPGGGIQG
jgi:hypothetical protein